MTTYKVQTWTAGDADWATIASFAPAYAWGVLRPRKRWWFPWGRTIVGVATNFVVAEKHSFDQAVKLAKQSRGKTWKTRVQRVSKWVGRETKQVLWQDGKRLVKLNEALAENP